MPGSYSSEGIQDQKFFNGPDGDYNLKIVNASEGLTGNGDPKVTVDYEIIDEGANRGLPISYHTVVFFKDKSSKGAGIAIKFLKAIGMPHEGNFDWDERNWIGRRLKAMIVMETQTQGKNIGKKFPKIAWVNPPDQPNPAFSTEDVPF
jgi:hypothetical protein